MRTKFFDPHIGHSYDSLPGSRHQASLISRFVQRHELPPFIKNGVEAIWLVQETVGTQVQHPLFRPLVTTTGQQFDWDMLGRLALFQSPQHVLAAPMLQDL